MRIVLPVHHFPPSYHAGAELYTLRLARWLRGHGHEVEVVCVEQISWDGCNKVTAGQDRYEGVPVWRLRVENAPGDWPIQRFDNPHLGRWFHDYLQRTQPDLVHFHAGYLIGAAPLQAAAALGVPTVLTLHDFWFLCPRINLLKGDGSICPEPPADPGACAWCMQLSGRAARWADRCSGGLAGRVGAIALVKERQQLITRRETLLAALGLPQAVIAPSHFLARRYQPYIAPERLHILRIGTDTTRLQATPRRPDDGVLRLAFIGQIGAHKGVHVLVEAVRSLPRSLAPIEVTLHGSVDQHPSYARKIRSMIGDDPRIRLAGSFDNSRLVEILGSCDATVLPSVCYENSPLAILEAQAARRPVLASAMGGMAELVRDEVDGLHFRPGDAADLARQIERLRSEAGLLDRLRRGVVPPPGIDDEMEILIQIYAATLEQTAQKAVVGLSR